jgi:thiol-disulfide isomerase/thioredoxin
MDVREPSQIEAAEALIKQGPKAVILVYSDWCGHCQTYKPTWKDLSAMPGRQANVISVKDDVFPQMKSIKSAKIQGYPSVIEVLPDGTMKEFQVPGSSESTNAVPYMRDDAKMKKALVETPSSHGHRKPRSSSKGFFKSIRNSLSAARNRLFGAKSYKSPKRHSHHAGTRKARRH